MRRITKSQQGFSKFLKDEFSKAFEKCDVIIAPTSPSTAWKFGTKSTPLENYMSDIFTVPVNIVGRPAISFPCGIDKKGLPIGVQLVGDMNREDNVYALAEFFERNHKSFKK